MIPDHNTFIRVLLLNNSLFCLSGAALSSPIMSFSTSKLPFPPLFHDPFLSVHLSVKKKKDHQKKKQRRVVTHHLLWILSRGQIYPHSLFRVFFQLATALCASLAIATRTPDAGTRSTGPTSRRKSPARGAASRCCTEWEQVREKGRRIY